MTAHMTIRIQQADFDIAREISALTKGRTDIGAVVSFSGVCRGSEDDQTVSAVTLEMLSWPLTCEELAVH